MNTEIYQIAQQVFLNHRESLKQLSQEQLEKLIVNFIEQDVQSGMHYEENEVCVHPNMVFRNALCCIYTYCRCNGNEQMIEFMRTYATNDLQLFLFT